MIASKKVINPYTELIKYGKLFNFDSEMKKISNTFTISTRVS